MTFLTQQPTVYEINTWVWLQRLSTKHGRRIDLSSIPQAEWDALGSLECDAVWLMGVWERSPAGRAIALHDPQLMAACRAVLPDLSPEDIPGSPYSIKAYRVDERLGSLGIARKELADRGLRLILDFVPNHVARDHRWVLEHPEYFIQGDAAALASSPQSYFEAGSHVIACGRDPYFPAWTDTAQLNAFAGGLRNAVKDTLQDIAMQCDGVRCDMAMLLLNDVFTRTWGAAAGSVPQNQYWAEVIGNVRQSHPHFLFIAEAYWNREWDVQQLGFDFCYDKRLYDRLVYDSAPSLTLHLGADLNYQRKLIRFLENHDEERAAKIFPLPRLRAAEIAISTLPGAVLYYEGQFCGAKIHLPVQLGRGPKEVCDETLEQFYDRAQELTPLVKTRHGQWQLRTVRGWDGNQTAPNLLAWSWEGENGRFLIVINFSDAAAQARVDVPWTAQGVQWILRDLTGEQVYYRDAAESREHGLYVARDAWQYHVFQFEG